ncbi:MAG TPA: Crp/Fnr family transcriptional regulator [Chloroflexota bacterium]|nr:Crp/Fnr family transcriptional regulator [Chloroflexota bacterium]
MTSLELQTKLAQIQNLRGLTYPVLRRLVQQGRLMKVREGEIIVGPRFGTKGAFVILEGAVSVVLPFGPVVSYLEANKMFGEIALLDGVERTAYCKAYTDCLLFEVPFGSFHADLATNPVVRAGMEELAVNRLNTNEAVREGMYRPDLEPPEKTELEVVEPAADAGGVELDDAPEPKPEAPKPPAVYATA